MRPVRVSRQSGYCSLCARALTRSPGREKQGADVGVVAIQRLAKSAAAYPARDVARADQDRYLNAQHHAGHAVASLARRGSEAPDVTISGGARHGGEGEFHGDRSDLGFFAYSGPWAEARALWPDGQSLDDEGDDGLGFDDYVFLAFLRAGMEDQMMMSCHQGDLAPYVDQDDEGLADLLVARDETWRADLERQRPAVEAVATALLRRTTLTGPQIERIVEAAQQVRLLR
jgi:hypothetical protein